MMDPMSPNANGQGPQSTWWVESWSSQITTGLAIFLVICGIITAISPINIGCIVPGILQLVASGIILSIEAPSFVPFLAFARPIGMFIEGKPYWFKGAFYAALALIPFIVGLSFGCIGFFFILGFLANGAIAALYGKIVLGRKANRDEMRFQAGGGTGQQPYSPTSP
ncbi:calcium channel flower [Dermatophagoides farinae]|uniref:Calcium channel flower n=1 Tax=Dermatophagoides farinae TaxID=6954 RepID=A0A922HVM5_DERFA|nr:calcium channel flower-like [Dermatophagoides farinae]KAH7642946.1 calcium channel flower-like protein [Dermatophagoides farinae]KAH9505967.1 Calcium channel flower [Dermatophagoides farinae]